MAKHLVQRMISLREHLIQTEERSRLWTLATKLIPKLADRAYTARELVRKCNRLSIADCRDALHLMLQEHIIIQVGQDQWQLALPVEDGLQKIRSSIVEV